MSPGFDLLCGSQRAHKAARPVMRCTPFSSILATELLQVRSTDKSSDRNLLAEIVNQRKTAVDSQRQLRVSSMSIISYRLYPLLDKQRILPIVAERALTVYVKQRACAQPKDTTDNS